MSHLVLGTRFRQLSRAEELEACRRVQDGDLAARRVLIESQLPLVWSIARRVAGHRSESVEDLFQTGVESLIGLVDTFDAARGGRLSRYCYRSILSKMRDYQHADTLVSRSPGHRSHGDARDEAWRTGLPSSHSGQAGRPFDYEQLEQLEVAIAGLPPRHQAVIRARLQEQELSAIAQRLGVSVGEAGQIETCARELLASALRAVNLAA